MLVTSVCVQLTLSSLTSACTFLKVCANTLQDPSNWRENFLESSMAKFCKTFLPGTQKLQAPNQWTGTLPTALIYTTNEKTKYFYTTQSILVARSHFRMRRRRWSRRWEKSSLHQHEYATCAINQHIKSSQCRQLKVSRPTMLQKRLTRFSNNLNLKTLILTITLSPLTARSRKKLEQKHLVR